MKKSTILLPLAALVGAYTTSASAVEPLPEDILKCEEDKAEQPDLYGTATLCGADSGLKDGFVKPDNWADAECRPLSALVKDAWDTFAGPLYTTFASAMCPQYEVCSAERVSEEPISTTDSGEGREDGSEIIPDSEDGRDSTPLTTSPDAVDPLEPSTSYSRNDTTIDTTDNNKVAISLSLFDRAVISLGQDDIRTPANLLGLRVSILGKIIDAKGNDAGSVIPGLAVGIYSNKENGSNLAVRFSSAREYQGSEQIFNTEGDAVLVDGRTIFAQSWETRTYGGTLQSEVANHAPYLAGLLSVQAPQGTRLVRGILRLDGEFGFTVARASRSTPNLELVEITYESRSVFQNGEVNLEHETLNFTPEDLGEVEGYERELSVESQEELGYSSYTQANWSIIPGFGVTMGVEIGPIGLGVEGRVGLRYGTHKGRINGGTFERPTLQPVIQAGAFLSGTFSQRNNRGEE
jgi:hypothetical protein